jgi:HEAT repeat protein
VREAGLIEPSEAIVCALAGVLNDPNEDVRRGAGVSLFLSGKRGRCVLSELIAALDHADYFIRRTSVAALSMIGQEARLALPKLKQLRNAQDEMLRSWVAEAIRCIATPVRRTGFRAAAFRQTSSDKRSGGLKTSGS